MATITPTQHAAMQKTARDFEAMFVSRMLESASAAANTKKSMFTGGKAEEQFRSLLNDHYGRSVAKHGGLGIAESVLKEMVRLQEAKP